MKEKTKSALLLIKKSQSETFKKKNRVIHRCEGEGNKVPRASVQG